MTEIVVHENGSLGDEERIIERGLGSFVEVGVALARIRDGKKYRDASYRTWDEYLEQRWPDFGKRQADREIAAAATVNQLGPIGPIGLTESAVRPLTALPVQERSPVWQRVIATLGSKPVTAALVTRVIDEYRAERAAVEPDAPAQADEPEGPGADEKLEVDAEEEPQEPAAPDPPRSTAAVAAAPPPAVALLELPASLGLAEWRARPAAVQRALSQPPPGGSRAKFNRTNDAVEWALWTWNPVTGCDHGCDYCYARDITTFHRDAFPLGFAPAFWPARVSAPQNMRVPLAAAENVGERNVFVCSMADLFGKWVPQAWLDAVFTQVQASPEWNYLFLTKFPQRLAELDWPANAWVGTTVDTQARVANAERSFSGVQAGIKWLSCEPLLERLTFSSLEMFDWVVIGGASRSTQTPAYLPPWEWVEHLLVQARAAGCQVYFKPNLFSEGGHHNTPTRPREYPTGAAPVVALPARRRA